MSLLSFIFGAGNQLEYEKNKAILAGPAEDIARIRKMDRQIGKLTAQFNGVSRVPDAVTKKIDAIVDAARPSIERVVAQKPYKENDVERAGSWLRGESPVTKVPLSRLEYSISYPASYGKPVEQCLAYLKVGK